MRLWAIKQKSTGFFLPVFPKNRSKGSTHLEPTKGCIPRLFSREQDAKVALDWWLAGKVTAHYDYEGEFSDIDIKHVPGRKHKDMMVVPMEVTESIT